MPSPSAVVVQTFNLSSDILDAPTLDSASLTGAPCTLYLRNRSTAGLLFFSGADFAGDSGDSGCSLLPGEQSPALYATLTAVGGGYAPSICVAATPALSESTVRLEVIVEILGG